MRFTKEAFAGERRSDIQNWVGAKATGVFLESNLTLRIQYSILKTILNRSSFVFCFATAFTHGEKSSKGQKDKSRNPFCLVIRRLAFIISGPLFIKR